MEITRDYITALATWSDPKEIMTKMGLRMLRVASPPKNFWDIWRAHKDALKQFGLSCKKDDHTGQWSLAWWMPLDEAEVARRNEAAEMSRAASADVDLPAPDGLAYLPYQRAGIQYALARPSVLIADEMGLGKAQPLDAKVLTPMGFVRMGDIKVGDAVIGSNGKATTVTGVFPQGARDVYEVEFSDGSKTRCCAEHLWTVNTPNRKWMGKEPLTLSLEEIMEKGLRDGAGNSRWFIPIVGAVEYFGRDSQPLIDPYLLGVLIGDGSLKHQASVCLPDDEVREDVAQSLPAGYEIRHASRYDYRIVKSGARSGRTNIVRAELLELGLCVGSHEKFIPADYKHLSIGQRIALLQGLMDTDGYCAADGTTIFYTTSKRLADDVVELVNGLGGVARHSLKQTTHKPCHCLTLALPAGVLPFRLSKKANRYQPRQKYGPTRAIVAVRHVGHEPVQCIRVSAADSLYVTDHFIVTHNTIQALGIINADETLKRVLIICPASLKINWQREAEKWLIRPLSIGIATGKFWPDTDIVIANYDILTKHVTMPAEKRKEAVELVGDWTESAIRGEPVAPCTGSASAITWDACIVDEAHLMKNPKAQRTRAIKQIKARRHIRMTGTPICNRPVELFPIISDLHERWHNWFQFSKRYCNLSFNEQRVWDALAGQYVTKNIADASGASRLDELQMFLRQTIMVRRLKRDVLTELPPKLRQVIEIPATGDLAALINAEADFARESAEDIAAAHDAVELSKASADESDYTAAVARLREVTEVAFTSMSKMRHDIAVAKVPAMIAHLRDCMEADDRKVVFFAHHHDVIDAVMAAAEAEGWRPVRVTGVDSMQDRQDAVDAFQRDPGVRLFCGNIKAAGVGLTLTASSHVVFGELDWVPGNVSQAEDRCHRIGQRDSVLVQHLVVERSTDAKMAKAIVAKQAIIDKALDRDAMVLQSIPVPLSIESAPAPVGAPARAREGAQGRGPTRAEAPAYTRTHEERVEAATANHTRAALVELAEKLTRPQIAAIGTAIRVLAGLDADFAQARNGEGFNKADGRIGHSLANLRDMTPMQAALSSKLVRRYRRQLDGALLEACGI